MKLYAPVTDIVRNEPIGYVVKTAQGVTCYGLNDTGKVWADHWNNGASKALTEDLPVYAQIGEFGIYNAVTEMGINLYKTGEATSLPLGGRQKLVDSKWEDNDSNVICVKDTRLSDFEPEDKIDAIAYKAHSFIADSQKASVLFKARLTNAGISDGGTGFKTRTGTNATHDGDFLDLAGSTGALRRVAKDVLATKTLQMIGHPGYGLFEKSDGNEFNDDLEVKRLGRTLGRRGRNAMRFISERFDRDAIDGDEDGMVQDGSAFERPALPNMGRVNKPNSDRWNADKFPKDRSLQPIGMASGRGEGLRGRQRAAVTERAGALRGGMASQRKIKRRTADAPGLKPVSEQDGTLFDSLTPQQQGLVKAAADAEQRRILGTLLKRYPALRDFWAERQAERRIKEDDPEYMMLQDTSDVSALKQYLEERIEPNVDAANPKLVANLKAFQKAVDNLQTLSNMQRRDNYELLEHLHPEARKNVVKGIDPSLKAPTAESTIFGAAGGFSKEKFAEVAGGRENVGLGKVRQRLDARQRSFARNILRPNPARQARRLQRQQRRAGILRRAGQADVERKRSLGERLARSKRNLMRKFRKQRTVKDFEKIMDRKRSHPLARDKDGKPEVDDKFVNFVAFIGAGIDARKKSGGENKRSDDDILLDSWENAGYNELPEQITEDELIHLLDNGWQFLFRGMGHLVGEPKENKDGTWSIPPSPRKFKSEREAGRYRGQLYRLFSDSYIEDPDRFIPQRSRRAHGTGEYWAPARSGHFGGYGGGLIGVIDPKRNTRTVEEMRKIAEDHSKINNQIRKVLASYPSGEDASKADPQEFVDQVRAALKEANVEGLLTDSEMGPIMDQILSMYASSDDRNRANIWQAIQYLSVMDQFDNLARGYYAPILGIDHIQDGEAVTLVHNRGAVAVIPESVGPGEARAIRDRLVRQ